MNIQIPFVEEILNRFPEVRWDRWSGKLEERIMVFGWLVRDDGKHDFVEIVLDKDGPYMFSTSSAQWSSEFCRRLGFDGHTDCKRVEDTFHNVRSIKLNPQISPETALEMFERIRDKGTEGVLFPTKTYDSIAAFVKAKTPKTR